MQHNLCFGFSKFHYNATALGTESLSAFKKLQGRQQAKLLLNSAIHNK